MGGGGGSIFIPESRVCSGLGLAPPWPGPGVASARPSPRDPTGGGGREAGGGKVCDG